MRNNLLVFTIVLMLFNTISFGAEVLAPGKDKGYCYQPYLWVTGPIAFEFKWALSYDYGQGYMTSQVEQENNPGTNPTCKVSVVKSALESHNYGVVGCPFKYKSSRHSKHY